MYYRHKNILTYCSLCLLTCTMQGNKRSPILSVLTLVCPIAFNSASTVQEVFGLPCFFFHLGSSVMSSSFLLRTCPIHCLACPHFLVQFPCTLVRIYLSLTVFHLLSLIWINYSQNYPSQAFLEKEMAYKGHTVIYKHSDVYRRVERTLL